MVHLNEILELNTEKRIELVEMIWDSVETDTLNSISDEMKTKLDERLLDLKQNPNAQSNWEEAYHRLKNSL